MITPTVTAELKALLRRVKLGHVRGVSVMDSDDGDCIRLLRPDRNARGVGPRFFGIALGYPLPLGFSTSPLIAASAKLCSTVP